MFKVTVVVKEHVGKILIYYRRNISVPQHVIDLVRSLFFETGDEVLELPLEEVGRVMLAGPVPPQPKRPAINFGRQTREDYERAQVDYHGLTDSTLNPFGASVFMFNWFVLIGDAIQNRLDPWVPIGGNSTSPGFVITKGFDPESMEKVYGLTNMENGVDSPVHLAHTGHGTYVATHYRRLENF